MISGQRQQIKTEVQALVEKFGNGRQSLIQILQALKTRHGKISDFAMQVVADELSIHPTEVYGVVTFYSFLGQRKQGKTVIRLCRTISCDMAKSGAVARQVEAELGIRFGETTSDGQFTLEWANCMGLCDQGPALMVNQTIYSKVTPERAYEIIEECRNAFSVYATNRDVPEFSAARGQE
jgi:NADH:ubiquinone oxidoreductase subunit E